MLVPTPVGVGVDYSETADLALDQALAQRAAPGRVVVHVLVDREAEQLAQLASDVEADILVVGSHGRRGIARLLLGSVSEAAVRMAPCPVLVVRPRATPLPAARIEPPCPRCLEERRLTDGRQFWCQQHRERHGRRHTYHQADRVSADGTFPMLFHS